MNKKDFFQEKMGLKPQYFNLVLDSLLLMISETLTFEDGRYSVGLPWKIKDHELPDNFNMTLRRLQNTEKRLQKSPELGGLQ